MRLLDRPSVRSYVRVFPSLLNCNTHAFTFLVHLLLPESEICALFLLAYLALLGGDVFFRRLKYIVAVTVR